MPSLSGSSSFSSEPTRRPRRWWMRTSATLKDNSSILFSPTGLHSSIVRATSHDESSVDHRSVEIVLSSIRSDPLTSLPTTMIAISRRSRRTTSWVVALKSLMLTHAILLCSPDVPATSSIGRLPFDLSGFYDRYSPRGKSRAFAAFVRSYYNFLDRRSVIMCSVSETKEGDDDDEEGIRGLRHVERLQELLDLLLQVRPYGDGVEVGLVVEAMDGIVTEIFEVYGEICHGIASSIAGIFVMTRGVKEGKGEMGIRVLKKAVEQSARLAAFFEVCEGLGVVKEGEVPKVETMAEEDVDELERMMVMMGVDDDDGDEEDGNLEDLHGDDGCGRGAMATVVTGEWVVFEEEEKGREEPGERFV